MLDTIYVTISKVDDKYVKIIWNNHENIISKKELYDFMKMIADNAK